MIITLASYKRAPAGCPRCSATDSQVDLAGWRWGTCRAHGLKWKIRTIYADTSADATDAAIKELATYWPANRTRRGGGPDAA